MNSMNKKINATSKKTVGCCTESQICHLLMPRSGTGGARGIFQAPTLVMVLTTCEATCRYLLSSSGFTSSSGTVLPLCERKTVWR